MKRPTGYFVCLALLTAVAFRPVLFAGFINYDDQLYVTDNPTVKAGLTSHGIEYAFTSTETANWYPLTWLSLMLDAQVYGAEPWGYHLTNLLLHVAVSLVLLKVLLEMVGDPRMALIIAALWAVHPLRVEPVAWVSSRKDVLSTLPGLLAIWAYVRYARRPSPQQLAVVAGLMLLSLTAKPMFITLPLLLLLLDYWPLGRTRFGPGPVVALETPKQSARELLIEKWPLWLLLCGWSFLAFYIQQSRGATADLSQSSIPARLGNVILTYALHVRHTIVPLELATPYLPSGVFPSIWFLLAVVAVVAAITYVTIRNAKKRPEFAVGWLWFVIAMAPVCGVVTLGKVVTADRYMYVPGIGLAIAMAYLVPRINAAGIANRFFTNVAVTAVVLVLAVLTWRQCGFWKDSRKLAQHALAVTDDRNVVAHANLAAAAAKLEDPQSLALAEEHDRAAIRHSPGYMPAWAHLAVILDMQGRGDEAEATLGKALRINPGSMEIRITLGNMIFKRWMREHPTAVSSPAQASTQPWDFVPLVQAQEHFEHALATDPRNVHIRNNLAVILVLQGRFSEAAEQYHQLTLLDPGNEGYQVSYNQARDLAKGQRRVN